MDFEAFTQIGGGVRFPEQPVEKTCQRECGENADSGDLAFLPCLREGTLCASKTKGSPYGMS